VNARSDRGSTLERVHTQTSRTRGPLIARRAALASALIASLLLVISAAAGAATSHLKTFQMPSHRIACTVLTQHHAPMLLCEIRVQPGDSGMPQVIGASEPKTCRRDFHEEWGGRVILSTSGKAVVYCPSDVGVEAQHPPVLAYGTSWSTSSIHCTSRTDGLHCSASGGKHGFFYNRSELRVR